MINRYHADISLSWGGHRYEKTAVRSIGCHRADNQYSHCWSRESTLHWWEAVGEVTNALSQKDFTRVHIPCVETVSFWSEPTVSHSRWLNFLVPPSGASTNLKEPHRSHRFQKHLTIPTPKPYNSCSIPPSNMQQNLMYFGNWAIGSAWPEGQWPCSDQLLSRESQEPWDLWCADLMVGLWFSPSPFSIIYTDGILQPHATQTECARQFLNTNPKMLQVKICSSCLHLQTEIWHHSHRIFSFF